MKYLQEISLHHFTLMCKKTELKHKEHWDTGEIDVLERLLKRPVEQIIMIPEVKRIMDKVHENLHGVTVLKGDSCKK